MSKYLKKRSREKFLHELSRRKWVFLEISKPVGNWLVNGCNWDRTSIGGVVYLSKYLRRKYHPLKQVQAEKIKQWAEENMIKPAPSCRRWFINAWVADENATIKRYNARDKLNVIFASSHERSHLEDKELLAFIYWNKHFSDSRSVDYDHENHEKIIKDHASDCGLSYDKPVQDYIPHLEELRNRLTGIELWTDIEIGRDVHGFKMTRQSEVICKLPKDIPDDIMTKVREYIMSIYREGVKLEGRGEKFQTELTINICRGAYGNMLKPRLKIVRRPMPDNPDIISLVLIDEHCEATIVPYVHAGSIDEFEDVCTNINRFIAMTDRYPRSPGVVMLLLENYDADFELSFDALHINNSYHLVGREGARLAAEMLAHFMCKPFIDRREKYDFQYIEEVLALYVNRGRVGSLTSDDREELCAMYDRYANGASGASGVNMHFLAWIGSA